MQVLTCTNAPTHVYGVIEANVFQDAVHAHVYLQQTMSLCVKRTLAFQHILVLFWVDVLIREVYRQPFQAKLHCTWPQVGHSSCLYISTSQLASGEVIKLLLHETVARTVQNAAARVQEVLQTTLIRPRNARLT